MMAAVETAGPDSRTRDWWRLGGARIRAFVAWWGHALAAWLPVRLRARLGWIAQRLLLRRSGGALRVSMWRGDEDLGSVELALVDMRAPLADPFAGVLSRRVVDVPRWLVLPADAVLRRRLTLPQAAAGRLREVLGFEIDRQTPFAVTQVHYDACLLARHGDDRIEAELVVVPRAVLDAELLALGPLAGTLAGIDVDDGDGGVLGVDLSVVDGRQRRDDPWRRWNLLLAAVAVLALAAGLWQILDNRTAAAALFAQEVAQEAQRARDASIEERRLLDLVEGIGFLQQTRAGRPTMVEVIDELARRLPDDTWLEKLSIEGDRILMIGLSGDASSLVRRLEGVALWRDPALSGTLQPDPRTRKDRFVLTAQLAIDDAPASAEVPDAR